MKRAATSFFLLSSICSCSSSEANSPDGGATAPADQVGMISDGSGGTSPTPPPDVANSGGTTGGAAPPSGGGSPSSGGTSSGTGGTFSNGPCTAHAVDPDFVLRWEDNFDTFDSDRWSINQHTFAENVAQFDERNVNVEDGYLKLSFTAEPTGEKQFRGAEVEASAGIHYGRFDTCVRWGRGGGVVGSLFTFEYNPWNEIDIEYLGGNPVGIQYNLIWNNGTGTGNQYDPEFDPLGYDPADDFHHYSIEWTPGVIRFYVDGELRHTEDGDSAAAITLETTLRMNLWASDTGFAGTFDPNAAPTESWYDWVRVYDYQP